LNQQGINKCFNQSKCKIAINNFAKVGEPTEIAYCHCGDSGEFGSCFFGKSCEQYILLAKIQIVSVILEIRFLVVKIQFLSYVVIILFQNLKI